MENVFFTFIKPYLSFIDSGELFRKPFRWVYLIIGIVNLIFPIYILYKAIDSGIFNQGGKYVFAFFLIWIVISFAGWVSFQLWWDRSMKISEPGNYGNEFVATPVFSHFIQTSGEWLGTYIGIVGFISTLIALIFIGSNNNFIFSQMGIGFIGGGIMSVLLMPVYGYLIIIIARFVAEQARAIAAIANNTKKG